jgi:GH15 family glucan-1,4-alpha-glucosidase
MSTPIEDYALLGDTRSAALVSPSGSVDWWCLPRFDGDPVCGRLLGGEGAGHLLLGPAEPASLVERGYLPGTPVLRTTWRTLTGRLTLTDGMVSTATGRLLPSTLLVRRAEAADAPVRVRVVFAPRHRWRGDPPRLRRCGNRVSAHLGGLAIAMAAEPATDVDEAGCAEIEVRPSQPLTVVITAAWREPLVYVPAADAWDLLVEDGARWRDWTDEVPHDVPFRGAVQRTLLVLRQLTYSPSGAPVAAVTTSLPEELGGSRNWDYRFTWPRDASIGVAAFLGLGKVEEAGMFFHWLLHASRLDRPRLPALFTLDGRRAPGERQLDGWPGYEHSRPVRTGNGARHQHQLDGYGWVVDAMCIYARHRGSLRGEDWRAVRGFVDQVAARWSEPDAGIWEERQPPAHHTHSKLMAWLALDRGLGLAEVHRMRPRRRRAWERAREAVAADLRQWGFNDDVGAYTRTYGGDDLDAAVLLLPLLGIEPAESPRVTSTIDAIRRHLGAGGPFLYRYLPGEDGLPGGEGAFLPCSFWLVQALAQIGRTNEATDLMRDLLDVAPLGLFAEEIDPTTGRFLGNYPQALTHASLLQAALALREAGVHD